MRRVCKSRANKQKSLRTKIHGKDALLQSRKGRDWQRVIADFCHDETLRITSQRSFDLHTGNQYLIELRSQQCAIDDHVVRCQIDQRAKALEESENHVNQVQISTRKIIQW